MKLPSLNTLLGFINHSAAFSSSKRLKTDDTKLKLNLLFIRKVFNHKKRGLEFRG